MRQFSDDLPQKIPVVVAKIKHLPMADKLGSDSLTEKLQSILGSTTSFLIASFPKWAARIFDIAAAFFLCIYFMLEGEHAYAYSACLLPAEIAGTPRRHCYKSPSSA